MEISLEGKVALVTGASKGIGKAIAKEFADSGAKVMLSSRKIEGLEAAAAEIGGDVEVFAAHAGKPEDAVAGIDETIERFGGLDILVNNAGANPYYGFSLGVDEARYDKTFEVNLRGPLFWSQVAWNKAFKDKPGVIMNIASVGGLRSCRTRSSPARARAPVPAARSGGGRGRPRGSAPTSRAGASRAPGRR